MDIEILTIGDELLLGITLDTNAHWLARELGDVGVRVVRRATVGDDAAAIGAAVREALERTGAVITTGGLGPTADDLTKPAIAALFGRPTYFDDASWERIVRAWRERGAEPPEVNRQQVMLPVGAEVLVNRHGTAPGLRIADDAGRWVAMLPGVPREMRGMFAEELLPRLRQGAGPGAVVIRHATVRTTGIAESQLPSRLGDVAGGIGPLSLAYLPGQEGVDLRLTSRDLPVAEADGLLGDGVAVLRQRLGPVVYAEGRTDLASVVLAACRERGLTVAVGESCTGGLLGARLTAIPGASDVFPGGAIAYDNGVKRTLLGVDERTLDAVGAVSEEVAREMAAGARRMLGTGIGIGITGIAGPGGGTPGKPVGLVWLAVDIEGDVRVLGARLIGDRAEVRFRATQAALDVVRRALLAQGPPEWPGMGAQPLPNPK